MTGVGGRPEVIIEGSNDLKEGWKEYEFLYKPGDPYKPMPFIGMSMMIFIYSFITEIHIGRLLVDLQHPDVVR